MYVDLTYRMTSRHRPVLGQIFLQELPSTLGTEAVEATLVRWLFGVLARVLVVTAVRAAVSNSIVLISRIVTPVMRDGDGPHRNESTTSSWSDLVLRPTAPYHLQSRSSIEG